MKKNYDFRYFTYKTMHFVNDKSSYRIGPPSNFVSGKQ